MKRSTLFATVLTLALSLLLTGCFDIDPGSGGGGYAPSYGYAPAAAPTYYNNRTVYRPVYRTVVRRQVYRTVIRQPVVRRRAK